MGQLNFQNLEPHRPDILMRHTFYGLKDFYEALQKCKNYLESDAAVKQLAWQPAIRTEETTEQEQKVDETPTGYWIQLTAPPASPNEPDATFRAFLDESVRELYAIDPTQSGETKSNARLDFDRAPRIKVLDRDPSTEQLLIEHKPSIAILTLRPNTRNIKCQLDAIKSLQDTPSIFHRPLLRLFEATDHAKWPDLPTITDFFAAYTTVNAWHVLTDLQRSGTEEQRLFVETGLNTPDFAFLEGPPGSGKTTAICELILQLVAQDKRVLLSASTHVAVDNVLEKLMDEDNEYRDQIIPIRIGDKSNVSDKAAPWQLENFIKTEKRRLLDALHANQPLAPSQKTLLHHLKRGDDVIQRLVLDSANLVCGTTIGILQHPDIKAKGNFTPQFDVLIIDEASKTTFQEFLVPALLAKRWILVGDVKQLSPYVDDEQTAINIRPCLPQKHARNACIDVYQASISDPGRRRTAIIATDIDDKEVAEHYIAQSQKLGVRIVDADQTTDSLAFADIVLGKTSTLEHLTNHLPLDTAHIRAPENALITLRRRSKAFAHNAHYRKVNLPSWSNEVAWRLSSLYEQRFNIEDENDKNRKKSIAEKLKIQLNDLLPAFESEQVWQNIDRVRRVVLPSVLESLQQGFERSARQTKGTALSDGLPQLAVSQRHVLLSYQHRMHPDIAAFPHNEIYNKEALFTPDSMIKERAWGYKKYGHHTTWHHVNGHFNGKLNTNEKEAKALQEHLKTFDKWAKNNPPESSAGKIKPWTVAILTFYRGQERCIRELLQQWSNNKSAISSFYRGGKSHPYMTIQLCTVDRFQGHEADLVLLSVANTYATGFLQSPNRLNVAATRARYQLVVFGNHHSLEKTPGIFGRFVQQSQWSTEIEGA